ncbi:MAG: cytochrome c [Bryobacteraceae bacterium]
MWKKIIGYTLLSLVCVAAAGFAYLYFRSPASAPPSNIKVTASPERIARGEYIYLASDCDGCHSPANPKLYDNPPVDGMKAAGQLFPARDMPGRIVVSNITPDKETGIGNWTDGEKIRAIREGISRDGHMLFPMMPYTHFRHMSDDDVQSLVAYLNSLPPVRNSLPPTKVDFPVSLLVKGAPRPVEGAVKNPDRSNKQLYGEYLATLGSCDTCHTPEERGEIIISKRFSGGRRFEVGNQVVVSANISPDKQSGIGDWSLDRFQQRFYKHREHAGKVRTDADPEKFTVMPWENLSHLPPEDLEALYIYLMSRLPIENKVESHPMENGGKT